MNNTDPETEPLPIAEFRGTTKHFGDVVAAEDLNLAIRKGEFLSFLGPSGCGKTTALRMLAGFETPTKGEVLLDGQVVNHLPAHKRAVNMVFQHYALFPHLNVADNISYGLRQQRPKLSVAEVADRVSKALETVRLPDFGPRRIWEMSGGQQQRVALARALINRPKLLLLDEPMAALDRKLRRDMQIELQTLQRKLGITFVLVTHDQEEALSMSDRICIMRGGRIMQTGSPRELYDRPRNRYVADFVGKSNFFDGRVTKASATSATMEAAGGLVISGTVTAELAPGQAASASLRPEQIALTRKPVEGDQTLGLQVQIVNRIFLGEHTEYLVRNDVIGEFLVLVPRQAEATEGSFEPGDAAHATWRAGTALILGKD
ncbi:ABC transporter ATP-binding protein [Ostreiculturibacter nitratireducens]|uniref:ABC transporter ATP-binding protein n=1 Tax=Ostreiculturibacter nitratireducens TaxID=3075226 RepID=UPI0031B59535